MVAGTWTVDDRSMTAPAPGLVSVAGDAGGQRAMPLRLLAVLIGAAVLVGLIAGQLAAAGQPLAVLGLAVVALPIVLWKRPDFGPVLLMVAATTIEQSPYKVGTRDGAATAHVPLFHGLGVPINPADLTIFFLVLVWVLKNSVDAPARWPRSVVTTAVTCLMGAVAYGLVLGVAHHGQIKTGFTEVRPYFYLSMTFLLTSVLLGTRTALRSMLWALVIGTGCKAVQGLLIFASARSMRPRPEAVLGHEEAFFFGLFIFITIGLWLYELRGPLRTTATAFLPLVMLADLVNTRRTAWLILGAGISVLLLAGLVGMPARRRFIGTLLAGMSVVIAVYLPAFWNHTGSLAQPARAVRAITSPSQRDASSDLYRDQENANLKLNIRQSRPLGKGFGVPIDYALPIADIKSIDPLITHVPHNGVLYIVMRMGFLGGVVFWSLLGVGIIGGCRLSRCADREVALVGTLVMCTLVVYALAGYNDQGFFFYRIAVVVGGMLGMGEVAKRVFDAEGSPAARPAISEMPALV